MNKKNRLNTLIFSISIIILCAFIVISIFANQNANVQAGGEAVYSDNPPIYAPDILGRDKVYPEITYMGKSYYWSRLVLTLPPGYVMVGTINHVSNGKCIEDFDFRAIFGAEGDVYYHADYPNSLIVQITTDWLNEQYVKFYDHILNRE